jgi:hypothetical protein
MLRASHFEYTTGFSGTVRMDLRGLHVGGGFPLPCARSTATKAPACWRGFRLTGKPGLVGLLAVVPRKAGDLKDAVAEQILFLRWERVLFDPCNPFDVIHGPNDADRHLNVVGRE